MHVLMLAQYFPPDFGGASTRAYNAAKGLVLQGYEVTVVSAFPHYPHGKIPDKYHGKFLVREEIDGINVLRTWIPGIPHSSVSNRLKLHLSFILSCLSVMTRVKKFDIVIAMNPNLFSFFPAWFYGKCYRKKVIRNVDDLWPEVFYELGLVKSPVAKKVLDSLARFSYQASCAIIPVSFGYVQTLRSKYQIGYQKIFVIEHGVNTVVFHPANLVGRNTETIVMYSGAITVGYDFESIIAAAKILESEPVHFIIRGVGELTKLVQSKIEEYHIKNIEIKTELLPIDELVSLLNSADIFLLPMSTVGIIDQGFPTKILEYQALGKPIVCSSSGEAARYIEKTCSGLVIPTNDPKALANSIMQLVNDKRLAAELGKNGFNNINANLTLEVIGKRLHEVIVMCMEKGRV